MTTIIGIDCACNPKDVGIAYATWDGEKAKITGLEVASKRTSPSEIVSNRLSRDESTLLAFDAPLGWPSLLAPSLERHEAGNYIPVEKDKLFHRHTDDVVEELLEIRPMEVGANLIARTAHEALDLLNNLRCRSSQQIPLAWHPSEVISDELNIFVIEVYPAATLKTHLMPFTGYKKNDGQQRQRRRDIVDALEQALDIGRFREDMIQDADKLDAVVCVLAGHDFLHGDCVAPDDKRIAKKEGWIWVRRPTHGT